MNPQLINLDFRDDASRSAVLRAAPVRSSARFGWHSLYFEHRQDQPLETAEHVIDEHYLMVKLNPVSKAQRSLDGIVRAEVQQRASTAYVPSGCPHRVRYAGSLGSLHLMTLPRALVAAVAADLDLPRVDLPPRHASEADGYVLEAAERIHAEVVAGNPHGRMFAEIQARALAAHLLTRYGQPARTDPKSPRLKAGQSARLDRYIDAHLAHPIGLRDLAAQVGLSDYYFCRCFKGAYGTTPYQYLLKKRIEFACACLRRDHASIQEVAFAAGFGDPVQFSKQFRRSMGLTPSAYRARELGRGRTFAAAA